jgi:proline iminopeptidase
MTFRLDQALFPPLQPYGSGRLKVDGLHELYWEQAGDPSGAPLLILHGGPGGGINPYYRQLFDPRRWQATLYEQRGCGRSTPHGELEHNTTPHLVADIEALRRHLGHERWTVLGGSWGSTLALAYAQRYPERCAGLVVTGVFLARPQDSDWWWCGARAIFPELWQGLCDFLPEAERGDLRQSYIDRILGDDAARSEAALKSMLSYETQLLDHLPNAARLAGLLASDNLLPMGRLYAHYDANRYFLESNQLLRDATRLKDVPGWIINGRYDACTPPSGAFDLSKAWPHATLRIMPSSAHVWNDPILGYAIGEALRDIRSGL